MDKLFKNKKGINDISILSVILSVFLLTSLIIPFVNAEFGTTGATLDEDNVIQDVRNNAESASTLNAFTVLLTMIKLAVFDFGDTLGLPLWLDIVYTLLAIIFTITLARNIWIGGGG